INEIIQRLAALENNLGGDGSVVRSPSGSSGSSNTPSKTNPERPPVSSRSASSSFTATAVSPALERPIEEATPPPAELSTIDRLKAVLETQRKMLLVTALEAAQATVFEESELCIEFAPEARHFRDTLSKPDNNKF